MNRKLIDDYIMAHESSYQAKYCYHSCDRLDTGRFRFHYYIRDPQLMQIDIYLDIIVDEEVEVNVLEDLHQHEKNAIAVDALKRVRIYQDRDKSLTYATIQDFIENPIFDESITSQDIVDVLNYVYYHEGKNPDSVYHFYTIYLGFVDYLLTKKDYVLLMESINFIFDEILYEVTWNGINTKYLDQEYMMHQAYIRSFIDLIEPLIDILHQETEMFLILLLLKLLKHPRFGFTVYPTIEQLIKKHPDICLKMHKQIERVFNHEDFDELAHLMYDLCKATYSEDTIRYREIVVLLIAQLVDEIITIVNHEDQLQLAWMFIQREGYDIILDVFKLSCNSYVFNCFKIKEIPNVYHPDIKQALVEAVQYYAKKLEREPRNLKVFDQITNCNALLIEGFK